MTKQENQKYFSDYPICFPTVDAAIIFPNGDLLLGKKADCDKMQFIGGFADPKSESFEDDIYREILEETSIDSNHIKQLTYISSSFIDDERYKNSPNKIKTLFYMALLESNSIQGKANDDIDQIFRIPYKEWLKDPKFKKRIVGKHLILLNMLKFVIQTNTID